VAVGVGPMIAGQIFDVSGSYVLALYLCAGAFFGGGLVIGMLGKPRHRKHRASENEESRAPITQGS
jgi:hypothetical protein